jgi:hypothetical protein
MRSVARLVALVAVVSLLAACSSEALPGQVVATIGPGAGLATPIPPALNATPADGSPGASGGLATPTEAATSAAPTEAPTPAPTATPRPYTGTVNLSGKVASDIPGTLVALPVTVTSVIDQNTKPRDVYAVALAAGTTLRIDLKIGFAWSRMIVANPGSTSLDNDEGTLLWDYGAICCFDRSGTYSFTAAVSGTYYVAFSTKDTSQRYTLKLSK